MTGGGSAYLFDAAATGSGWLYVPAVIMATVAFFALYLVFAPLFGTWPHHRLPSNRRGTQASTPSFRTAGVMTGHATVGHGLVLPDGRTKTMYQGPMLPGPAKGSLPVVVDMEGLEGERSVDEQAPHDEVWVFRAMDVVLVNESDKPIICSVLLVVDLPAETLPFRELRRNPNQPVSLDPGRPTHVDLEFPLPLLFLSEDTRLKPGEQPRELVFIEIGSEGRELRISFGGAKDALSSRAEATPPVEPLPVITIAPGCHATMPTEFKDYELPKLRLHARFYAAMAATGHDDTFLIAGLTRLEFDGVEMPHLLPVNTNVGQPPRAGPGSSVPHRIRMASRPIRSRRDKQGLGTPPSAKAIRSGERVALAVLDDVEGVATGLFGRVATTTTAGAHCYAYTWSGLTMTSSRSARENSSLEKAPAIWSASQG